LVPSLLVGDVKGDDPSGIPEKLGIEVEWDTKDTITRNFTR